MSTSSSNWFWTLLLGLALLGITGHWHCNAVVQVWSSLGEGGYGNHVFSNVHLRPVPADEQLPQGPLEVPVEESIEHGVDSGIAVPQPSDDLEGFNQDCACGVAAPGSKPHVQDKVRQPTQHKDRNDDADGPCGLVLQLQVVLPLAVRVVVDVQGLRHDTSGLEPGSSIDEEVHTAHDHEGDEKRKSRCYDGKNPVGDEDTFRACIEIHPGDLIPALHDRKEGNKGGVYPDCAGHHNASAKGWGEERGSELL